MGTGRGKARRVQGNSSGFAIGNAFEQKYHAAVQYLDKEFAYFLTHVLNIGKPIQNSGIGTACVGLPKKGARLEDFQFLFSPEFAEELDDKDMGFILAHETMHILLNHLRIAKDFANAKLFNYAADAVINDYLVDIGLRIPDKGLVTGDNLVGHNCMHSTVTEVYDEVRQKMKEMGLDPDNPSQGQPGDGQGQGQPGDGQGQPSDGQGQGQGQPGDGFGNYGEIDDHDWMHNPAPGSADRAQQEAAADAAAKHVDDKGDMPRDLKDKKHDEQAGHSRGYSLSDGGSEIAFAEDRGVKLQWAKLLKEIDPDIIKKRGSMHSDDSTYSRPNRKTMQYYPGIILPGRRDDEPTKRMKPSIVLALDTSGSIGSATANKFVNLARSIPQERVHLHVCTFTTQYSKLDLENPRFQSGGTNFSAIENFIRKEVLPESRNRYPKAVIVITDGQAIFDGVQPKKEEEKSWHWLLTERSRYARGGPAESTGKKYDLDDFI